MKKILFITSNFLPSKLTGSEEFIKNIAYSFKNSYEVTVLTHVGKSFNYIWNPLIEKLPSNETINGVNIVRLEVNHLKSFFLILIKSLFKIINRDFLNLLIPSVLLDKVDIYIGPNFIGLKNYLAINEFDTIHVGPMPYKYLLHTNFLHKSLKLKSKFICTPFFHETQNLYYSDIFKKFMTDCDLIHAVSDFEKNLLVNEMGIKRESVIKIPLFLDTKDFKDSYSLELKSKEFKEKFEINNNEILIFGIGDNRRDAKGIEYTIQALNLLNRSRYNICLISAGGNYRLENFKIKSDFRIINLGHVSKDRMEVLFYLCDIFCMPSQIESFGLVYLEAWAKRKPVVAFKTGAVSELLSEGALLAEFKDIKDLSYKLQFLIDSYDERLRIGNQGYNRFIKNFTKEKVIESYKKNFFN